MRRRDPRLLVLTAVAAVVSVAFAATGDDGTYAAYSDHIVVSGAAAAGTWGPTIPAECDPGQYHEVVEGTPLDDVLEPGNGKQVILGYAGDDVIVGANGKDCIVGGIGDDSLDGNNGKDVLVGGPGGDVLRGANGPDSMYGGQGTDTCESGNGPRAPRQLRERRRLPAPEVHAVRIVTVPVRRVLRPGAGRRVRRRG